MSSHHSLTRALTCGQRPLFEPFGWAMISQVFTLEKVTKFWQRNHFREVRGHKLTPIGLNRKVNLGSTVQSIEIPYKKSRIKNLNAAFFTGISFMQSSNCKSVSPTFWIAWLGYWARWLHFGARRWRTPPLRLVLHSVGSWYPSAANTHPLP